MADLTRLNEARVQDGAGGTRLVGPGDQVNLSPEMDIESAREWLGQGPYTILWIGQWPCGQVMLHLKTTGGQNSGEVNAPASEFKCAA
ncbi:MAG: hypothetical protein WC619_02985 [Patescibacteria group bacterium]